MEVNNFHLQNKFKVKFDDDSSEELLDAGMGWPYQQGRYYPSQPIGRNQDHNPWPLQDELDEVPLTSSTTTTTEAPSSASPDLFDSEEKVVDTLKSSLSHRNHASPTTNNNYLNKETVDIPSVERAKVMHSSNLLSSSQQASHSAYSSENAGQGQRTTFGDVWFVGK